LGDTGSGRPGELLDPDDEPRDPLFGNVTRARAGWLDLVLVVVGVLLVAWGDLIDPASPDIVLGLGAIVLGLAIPVRDGFHALDRRWARIRGMADVD
jgi:drug/metabolite transporter (DMT)-like permease